MKKGRKGAERNRARTMEPEGARGSQREPEGARGSQRESQREPETGRETRERSKGGAMTEGEREGQRGGHTRYTSHIRTVYAAQPTVSPGWHIPYAAECPFQLSCWLNPLMAAGRDSFIRQQDRLSCDLLELPCLSKPRCRVRLHDERLRGVVSLPLCRIASISYIQSNNGRYLQL